MRRSKDLPVQEALLVRFDHLGILFPQLPALRT
jgi:hypothetical protein